MYRESQTQSLPLLQRRLYGTVGLSLLIGFYLLAGLTGHDLWRGDDARYFGPVHSMLQGEGLLFPQLGGEPFLEYPPLYYWCAALLAFITGGVGVFAPHDGVRLASAIFTALTVYWVARSAEYLHGRLTRTPAALLTLGSLGLVLHSHETQPLLALMAMIALVIYGISRVPERPLTGSLQAGLGCALAMLAGGIPGMLFTAPLFVVAIVISPECHNSRASGGLLVGLTLAICVGGGWPLLLHLQQPELFALWRHSQWDRIAGNDFNIDNFIRLIKLLSWFLWPLWPFALWSLWRERGRLFQLRWLLPLLGTAFALVLLVFSSDQSQSAALPLLPATALLAAGGVSTLRRGAANAFDWFSAMTFGVFAILVWVAWTAQVFTWPPGLANHIARTAPAFTLTGALPKTLLGICICLLWFFLVWWLPRRPARGATNWTMGMTMLWCLAVTLLMPWFDHGRSYRPMGEALNKALAPYDGECVASGKLPDPIRSMLDYYVGLRPIPVRESDSLSSPCRLLLVYTDHRTKKPEEIKGRETVWTFRRGGRRQFEALYLYARQNHE
ncbi:MAG: glycosyltransferase family 39 protein [Azoarcus sp.]|jgi:4-amino-4-deoxy-L-arabinose transferase-like glycosyltransferase|nr:glycosyltransferase family 39 protein [Azoarcus sp.]